MQRDSKKTSQALAQLLALPPEQRKAQLQRIRQVRADQRSSPRTPPAK
jgi:hypothetical protein